MRIGSHLDASTFTGPWPLVLFTAQSTTSSCWLDMRSRRPAHIYCMKHLSARLASRRVLAIYRALHKHYNRLDIFPIISICEIFMC